MRGRWWGLGLCLLAAYETSGAKAGYWVISMVLALIIVEPASPDCVLLCDGLLPCSADTRS